MFELLLKYWPLFTFGGVTTVALLRLFWRVSAVEKDIKKMKESDKEDMKEIKAALKENMNITTQTNLSGKGVIPPSSERRTC
jgi:hypothetical protein